MAGTGPKLLLQDSGPIRSSRLTGRGRVGIVGPVAGGIIGEVLVDGAWSSKFEAACSQAVRRK
jgi:hypothetical protein